ncbi:MAG: hypothetical protein K9J74_10750 [Sulfuritalea sp.]|nr:hypothetical protein [Sulfuritalea sp.]
MSLIALLRSLQITAGIRKGTAQICILAFSGLLCFGTQIALAQQTSNTFAIPSDMKFAPSGTITLKDGTKLNTTTLPKDYDKAITVISAKPATRPDVSRPTCGGVENGRPQAKCQAQSATFESAAVGKCPSGTFFDIGKWQCYSCPKSYKRTAAAVDTDRACSKTDSSVRGELKSASFVAPLCAKGTFYDPIRGGECWSCPSGYKRSAAHIDAANACFIPGGEEIKTATNHGRGKGLLKTDCAKGQFWDPNGNCYSCPSGFNRSAAPVTAKNACSRRIAETHAKASVAKAAACGPGEIRDLKVKGAQSTTYGGGCWRCPTAYDRTVFPVDGSKACEKGGGVVFAKASLKASLTCPADQIFDFIGLTQADISSRRLSGVKPVASGTCWSCPTGTKRSLSSVKGNAACEATTIGWYSAPFVEPGLFGLAGADEVLLELVKRDPKLVAAAIQTAAESAAKGSKRSVAALKASEEKLFATAPQKSTAAAGLVLARMIAAIADPKKASAAEKKLVQSFSDHVKAKRTHIAKDALAAYDAWKAADEYHRNHGGQRPGMAALFDYGTVPPDFSTLALANALAVSATSTAVGIAAGELPVIGDVLSLAIGSAANGFADFANVDTVGRLVARTAIETAIGKALELATERLAKPLVTRAAVRLATLVRIGAETGGRTLSAAVSVGPQIIIAAEMMLLQMAIEQMDEIANARPKLLTAVAGAKQVPELARMAQSDEGMSEILGLWSFLVSVDKAPTSAFLSAYTPIANKIVAAKAAVSSDTKAILQSKSAAKAMDTNTMRPGPAQAGRPEFDIVSAGKTCLQAAPGGALSLVACNRPSPSRWVFDNGKLKTGAGHANCLTLRGAALVAGKCAPTPVNEQAWQYKGGQIALGGKQCLLANGSVVAVTGCNPVLPMQKWQVTVTK